MALAYTAKLNTRLTKESTERRGDPIFLTAGIDGSDLATARAVAKIALNLHLYLLWYNILMTRLGRKNDQGSTCLSYQI